MKKVILLIVLLIFVGCASTSLLPEAQKVRIVRTEPGKECEYFGEVTGEQGDWFTGAYTSIKDLEGGTKAYFKQGGKNGRESRVYSNG